MIPICVRIDADDKRSFDALKLDGWREIEVLETYRGKPDAKHHDLIRRALDRDLLACIAIAEKAFTHDRLHADPNIPLAVATEAKAEWVRKCFADRSCAVFVYADPAIRGFIALKWIDDGALIDLIATNKPRQHICSRLVKHAMADLKPSYLRAGTQQKNQEGRLFYSALGMTCIKRQRTLHKP